MQLRGSPGGGGSGSRLDNSRFPSNICVTCEESVRWDRESLVRAVRITTNFTASCSRDASQATKKSLMHNYQILRYNSKIFSLRITFNMSPFSRSLRFSQLRLKLSKISRLSDAFINSSILRFKNLYKTK